jgi:hypothetical protein
VVQPLAARGGSVAAGGRCAGGSAERNDGNRDDDSEACDPCHGFIP